MWPSSKNGSPRVHLWRLHLAHSPNPVLPSGRPHTLWPVFTFTLLLWQSPVSCHPHHNGPKPSKMVKSKQTFPLTSVSNLVSAMQSDWQRFALAKPGSSGKTLAIGQDEKTSWGARLRDEKALFHATTLHPNTHRKHGKQRIQGFWTLDH